MPAAARSWPEHASVENILSDLKNRLPVLGCRDLGAADEDVVGGGVDEVADYRPHAVKFGPGDCCLEPEGLHAGICGELRDILRR